ncbi:MAG: thiol-disulfide oxidoreductase DCC family protein [Lewinellaceae bacterium]|nr:thiol-disulfide oxidoreductase DCC family protein [Lewinellaceae bacterium]
MESDVPILLFDGVCNLCQASVQWVLLHDKAGIFRFASLQSDTGQQQLARFNLDGENFDTVVLVVGSRVYTRSGAALEILRRLGIPWSIFSVLIWIPRPIRDAVYNWIARNRYRWFGQKQECWLPRPEWSERFYNLAQRFSAAAISTKLLLLLHQLS